MDNRNSTTRTVETVTCRIVLWTTLWTSTSKTLFNDLFAAMNSPLAPMTRLTNATSPMASEPWSRLSTAPCIRPRDVGK